MKSAGTYRALWLGGTVLASVPGTLLLAGLAAGTAHAVPSYAYANVDYSNLALSLGTSSSIMSSSVIIDDKSAFLGYAADGHTSSNGNLLTGATVAQAYSGPGPTPAAGFGQELTTNTGARAIGNISGAISGGAASEETSEGHLTAAGTGSSDTTSKTAIEVKFTAVANQKITLSFDYAVNWITSITVPGDAANASVNALFQIKEVGVGQVYNASTNGTSAQQAVVNGILNSGTDDSTHPANTISFTKNGALTLSFTTATTGTYTLNINSGSAEQITGVGVPEPASLALLGTGLLGVGMMRRRRRLQ